MKWVRQFALSLFALTVTMTLMTSCAPVYTKAFRDAQDEVLPGSVAVMAQVQINGTLQSVWFRGISTDNPALILLHGGPGASESALFRHYNSELEKHFLVVYWEQRGAGRSYHSDIPPASMTIEQFVDDLHEIVKLVERRFGKEKVVLLGHSWGTVIGTLYTSQHPEDVAAYVGVGQVADVAAGERLSYRFALNEALRRHDPTAIRELRRMGPPPHTVDEMLAVGRWVERFGGDFHADMDIGSLIWAALSTDEANLDDLIKFGQGNAFSLEYLWPEYSHLALDRKVLHFKMPVFFLEGRYDWNVPTVLAKRYFRKLHAPYKKLVWFSGSAHNPPFEQPEMFNRVMVQEVLPIAKARLE